jgi:hypothetical protein
VFGDVWSVRRERVSADGGLELSIRRCFISYDGTLRPEFELWTTTSARHRKHEIGASLIALEGEALQTQTEECAERYSSLSVRCRNPSRESMDIDVTRVTAAWIEHLRRWCRYCQSCAGRSYGLPTLGEIPTTL